jgi:lipoprotein-anchoring transpeptidase ErfK/SrfK
VRDSELLRTGQRPLLRGRRAGLAITGVCGALCLVVAACSSSAPPSSKSSHGSSHNGTTTTSTGGVAQVKITPGNGSGHVKPNKGVSVTVTHGKLQDVKVSSGHDGDAGTLSANSTAWHTTWPLRVGTHYTVTATAVGTDGKSVTTTSSFTTLRPAQTVQASTILGNETYGVGIPIMIDFDHPVDPRYRAAVERAVEIKSSQPVTGAWEWDTQCDNGTTVFVCLNFRPRQYWPQHTKVSFDAHFNGIEVAPGVYGAANLSQSFKIGWSLIGVTSTKTHLTRIYWKGKYFQTWTDSSGMPGDDTADGTYLTIEKANPTLMSGPGYKNVPVYWSVRFTWSGNYYHDAPWSLGEQGYTNVSHGCVNLSPQHSEWYYVRADPGDPITITGSPVAGKWDDGYTEWFLSWNQLLKHYSATHEAVQVGPNGSTFVDPSTLPAHVSDSTLHGSKPGNFNTGTPLNG